MIEPTWKLISLQPNQTVQSVYREWPDGKYESMQVTAKEYLAWIEKGNQPLPADE